MAERIEPGVVIQQEAVFPDEQLEEAARLFGSKLLEFTNNDELGPQVVSVGELDAQVLSELVAA